MLFQYNDYDLAFRSLIKHSRIIDDLMVRSDKFPKNEKYSDFYYVWFKALLHAYSLKQLISGTKIDVKNIIYDYSSAYIISRALYECVLTSYYLFSDIDSETSEFRYLLWKYGCYYDRSSFSAYTEDTKVKKEEAEKLKIEYKNRIQESSIYKGLQKKDREKIDYKISRGDWRLESWGDIGKRMNFTSDYYKKLYNVLCSYAHTGNNSIYQLKSASNTNEMNKLMFIPNTVLCLSIANLLDIYYTVIEKFMSNERIDINDVDIRYYKFYLSLGKKET